MNANEKYQANFRSLTPSSLEKERSFTNISRAPEDGTAEVKPAASPNLKNVVVALIVVVVIAVGCIAALVVVLTTKDDGEGDHTTVPPRTTTTDHMTTTISIPTNHQTTSIASTSSQTTTGTIDGIWSTWGDWTKCTSTCDSGIHKRYRRCEGQDSNQCLGDFTETEVCVEMSCPEYGKWTTWGPWESCGVSCGGGFQSRTRSCSKAESSDIDCIGTSFQEKTCNEWKCPVSSKMLDCSRVCDVGVLDDDCDICFCDGEVVSGRVLAVDTSNPVSNAVFYWSSSPTKNLGESSSTGLFTLENMCPESELIVSRPGFVDAAVLVTTSYLLVNMSKTVSPYLTKTPQSKNRLVGEDVTLCCDAVASPPINYYEWMKDGLIIEETLYAEGNQLKLFSLSTTDSGSYKCRANTNAGAIMSPTATLNVKEISNDFCIDALQQKTIALPDDCVQPRTNTATYNVGECISKGCRENTTSESNVCHEDITSCCTIGDADLEKVQCSDYELDVIVIRSCSCGACASTSLTVFGTALGLEDGSPLRYGEVFVNGVYKTFTSNTGTFSFVATKDSPRITLNLRDVYLKQFLPAVKVIEINDKMNGNLRVKINMIRTVKPIEIESTTENTLIAGASASKPIVQVSIPANAFYYQNGTKFEGTVQASFAFVDPTNISTFNNIPGSFEIVNQEGERAELASQAIFNLFFEDLSGNPLILDDVIDLYLPLESGENVQDRDVKLWRLNTKTGIWEYITQGPGKRRRKRQESARWIGEIDWSIISGNEWLNYDYVYDITDNPCYFKIRLFQDETMYSSIVNPEKQIEVTYHILRDNKTTLRTISDYIYYPESDCVIGICENETAYITLHYYGRKGYDVLFAGKPELGQSNQYFELMDNNKTLKLQMSSKSIGPFYDGYSRCSATGKDENHLRYHYGETSEVFTYNKFFSPTQGNIENQILISQRTWFPKRQEGYRVCFVKVRILVEIEYLSPGQFIKLRATSKGGTNENTHNFTFGIREYKIQNLTDISLCVEYKCSGTIDPVFQEMDDFTKIELKLFYPESEMTSSVTQEADFLTDFQSLPNVAQIGRTDGIYEIYAPTVYTPDLGLYSATSDQLDIESATNTAEGECISGTPQNLDDQNPDLGVAVYFSLN
ncbi:cartilage intermediate layer protein 1-like [Ruditapes philippinarum]|uniref:cartilage intermediate layer protein 1-like n=1 Tax=Ruditapes philippinarum TaxID=129788 RepID=UPI00295BFB95|nr:cartilage intermediate layer protein 1-like [Ruditapes philippinarum]